MSYVVAFVGNPNVGKSAWINALSHATFKVGNWAGVTVEKKEADVHWENAHYHLIDLPGTHSLKHSTNEENITSTFLQEQHVDFIVNVVDATNLASNFFLTLCLRTLQIPMLIIFNFMDEVERYHIHLEINRMATYLQVPILAYSAFDQKHHSLVIQHIVQHVHDDVYYAPLLSEKEHACFTQLSTYLKRHVPYDMNKEAVQQMTYGIIAHGAQYEAWLAQSTCSLAVVNAQRKELAEIYDLPHHYQMISILMQYVVCDDHVRYQHTQAIDRIVLHRFLGLPICFVFFSVLLFLVFQISTPLNAFIAYVFDDVVTRYVGFAFAWAPQVIQQLCLQGIIAGIGGVLTFVPLMALLYFMLSLLEESGYMSRISFLLDRFMRIFHLSGKSFVSLLLGFGCNVPAIYATRCLDNEKQRRLTAILIPFMSCGARLPVYVLFAGAFFPHHAIWMLLSVYGIGLFMALLFALCFSKTSYMRDDAMYTQELPPYRFPSMRVVIHKVKEEVSGYVKKALGIVLWAMILLWALTYFPDQSIHNSYIAQAATFLQPIFEPLGFGTRWESIASLPGGIIAKETIVGYFEQVLHNEHEDKINTIQPGKDIQALGQHMLQALQQSIGSIVHPQMQQANENAQSTNQIQSLWPDRLGKLRAFSFMVYVLLSIPCVMTMQALYHVYGRKLLFISIITMCIVPYITSLLLFQILSRLFF